MSVLRVQTEGDRLALVPDHAASRAYARDLERREREAARRPLLSRLASKARFAAIWQSGGFR